MLWFDSARPSAFIEVNSAKQQRSSLQVFAMREQVESSIASNRQLEPSRYAAASNVNEVINQHRNGKDKSARLSRIGADLSKKLGSTEYWPAFLSDSNKVGQIAALPEKMNRESPGLISVFKARDLHHQEESSKHSQRIVGIMKNKNGLHRDQLKISVQNSSKRTMRYSGVDYRGTATERSSPLRAQINAKSDKFS
jgi:hypothetical protein